MAKDPAFLFYPNDFTSGTQFFTDDQVGKYIRILMAQHQHGHLTENQVIFICKSHDNEVFSKLTKDSQGLWYNERLQIEIDKRKNFVLSRSKNKEGKTKNKIISKTYDNHMENRNENENIDVNYIEVEEIKITDPMPILEFYAVQLNGTQKENNNKAWRPLVEPWFLEHLGEAFNDNLHVKNSFKKYYISKLGFTPKQTRQPTFNLSKI